MSKLTIHCALAAISTISAAVPNSFSSGKPVIAQDVNANFSALDSAIQNRATTSAVSAIQSSVSALQSGKADAAALAKKADSTWIAGQMGAKADTGKVSKVAADVSALTTQVGALPTTSSLKGIRDTLGTKFDTVKARLLINQINSIGSNSLPTSAISGTASSLSKFVSSTSLGNANMTDDGSVITNLLPVQFPAFANFGSPGGEVGLKQTNPVTISSTAYSIPFIQSSSLKHRAALGFTTASVKNLHWGIGKFDDNPYSASSTGDFVIEDGSGPATTAYFPIRITPYSGTGTIYLNRPTVISADLTVSGKINLSNGAVLPADYVFEPDYKLAPLSEVEAYTKANKHLPEVPSAAEMTSKGVDVAAMNMVLLKKVEELTLHAIALQKDVEAQKALLADQQKAMVGMKAYLESLRKN